MVTVAERMFDAAGFKVIRLGVCRLIKKGGASIPTIGADESVD